MYKSIDILDLIGSTIYLNEHKENLSFELLHVIKSVEERYEDIRVETSARMIKMIECMSENSKNKDVIELSKDKEIRHQLVIKYFQLDHDTRNQIDSVIKDIIKK